MGQKVISQSSGPGEVATPTSGPRVGDELGNMSRVLNLSCGQVQVAHHAGDTQEPESEVEDGSAEIMQTLPAALPNRRPTPEPCRTATSAIRNPEIGGTSLQSLGRPLHHNHDGYRRTRRKAPANSSFRQGISLIKVVVGSQRTLDPATFKMLHDKRVREERRMAEYLRTCPRPLPPSAVAALCRFPCNGKLEEK